MRECVLCQITLGNISRANTTFGYDGGRRGKDSESHSIRIHSQTVTWNLINSVQESFSGISSQVPILKVEALIPHRRHQSNVTTDVIVSVWGCMLLGQLIFKGYGCWFSTFVLLSTNLMWRATPTINTSYLKVLCVSKAWYLIFLCVIDLHCCLKTIKNTSVSPTVALYDMFLYHKKFKPGSLSRTSCFQCIVNFFLQSQEVVIFSTTS